MSEETPPAKKAARKSVRKKSASKRGPRKSPKSESETSDEQLPLEDNSSPATGESPSQEEPQDESKFSSRQGREPRSGVRDARRETAGDPLPVEVTEKLLPDDDGEKSHQEKSHQERSHQEQPRQDKGRSNHRKESKGNPEDSQKDQGQQDPNDRRGRGRGRGGRDRNEKRESKARFSVDSKDLAKKAWKIFESEVTEEGLALLDDNGMRDYAQSSFNAARIFLEEEKRIVGREKQERDEKEKDSDHD